MLDRGTWTLRDKRKHGVLPLGYGRTRSGVGERQGIQCLCGAELLTAWSAAAANMTATGEATRWLSRSITSTWKAGRSDHGDTEINQEESGFPHEGHETPARIFAVQ